MTFKEFREIDMVMIEAIEQMCCQALKGKPPPMQGAVLACLVARHLAAIPESVRAASLENLLKTISELEPLYRQNIAMALAGRTKDQERPS